MRLLEVQHEIHQLPESYKTAALRLPIKVDLRDLASWLARRNPFTPEGGEIASGEWTKSLEAFLSALIRYQSGGIQFDVADLHAVARLSAILLVFDGLDEVADIDRRREVVDEIVKGLDRLEANAALLQVVVTSRPAAFANSPGLPEDKFIYLELGDLSRDLIDEYAEKWLKARRLHERESAEVKKILKEKLTQPHLRDLARNPMQLAILLSLIHTRGTSLPDKRTALYDNYIELFFNREAEKSLIVRDHRELLININRYLAWLLHSEVELGNERDQSRRNGAIAADRLTNVLKDYLENDGHDPELAQILFTGMVERVVALVSRVQGTYEFEVQPLREYFAARFLYETAPYSPAGPKRAGRNRTDSTHLREISTGLM
jgi:predicted NACHT family NTPase